MTAVRQQLAFDFDALTPPPPIPEYTGRAPLHFTAEFYTVDELAEAFARWVMVNGSFGSHVWSHMWVGAAQHPAPAGHEFATMHAEIRHTADADHGYGKHCECVGMFLQRAQCDPCRWVAHGTENEVVEAWHDHAWPGWRDLPVVPLGTDAAKWTVNHYPPYWQVTGAPVLTTRKAGGTRHVPGRSPWDGYDITGAVAA